MSERYTITLPFPDHGLTKNRTRSYVHFSVTMKKEHAAKDAADVALMLYKHDHGPTTEYPLFPDGDLFLIVRCERRKRGQRWDHGGITEALKPYIDALQGWFYANDRQVIGNIIFWDDKPTGTGVVHLTFVRATSDLIAAEARA